MPGVIGRKATCRGYLQKESDMFTSIFSLLFSGLFSVIVQGLLGIFGGGTAQ